MDIRHLPLARVALEGRPDQVFYAFPAAAGGVEVVELPSRRRVSRIAGIAAAVVAVLAFALLLIR
ncbi:MULTISPECIES: hypothetical protein [unclassified Streptomyces]|uniref:hypothetical protein n=1 Tax=unclassified Streptomyces TaxID=2593676 RepID=UPI001BE82576|nr:MULTISPECIES: hypothetical protein [unclassified Streptomyces]MBT2404489.1 hypothetical protein [Streptomyces sp. ISL-21]MBT2456079.1 hypothetical protein [Streptomyces sp. ISL-86]MBT2608779.1 hypothetical protein [Streptomyces sp. ISL-87]